MPVTPADRILNAGIAIAELFRTGELDIISLLAAVCGKGKRQPEQNLKRLRQKKTRNRFSTALNQILLELQQKAYQEAMRRLAQMYEATAAEVEALSEYIEGDLARSAADAQKAVQDLLDDLNAQWLQGLKNMRRKADDVYRHVIELEQANADAAGDDLRKAVEEALQSFAEKGVTGFTDRANRNWGLAEYSEMAMRTAMQRANLLATIDAMLRSGQDLCYVNRHMGSCPMCMHWEGVLISLTGRTPGYITLQQAMSGGLFHPNCAHILLVYIPGVSRLDIGRPKDFSSLENRKLYLKRQQQRYLERNVRKWKKKQAAAITPGYERYCMHQVEYWQGRIRKHIKDNPELPRRYDREGGKVVLSELAKAKTEGKTAAKAPRDTTWKRLITTPEQAAAIGNLQNSAKSGMIIPDKQIGRKAGKHMIEWNLDPSDAEDRAEYIRITNEIHDNADEIRRVPWKFDRTTGKRTVEVNAYIKGSDVVLVDDDGTYITTMKNGANNARIRGGRSDKRES